MMESRNDEQEKSDPEVEKFTVDNLIRAFNTTLFLQQRISSTTPNSHTSTNSSPPVYPTPIDSPIQQTEVQSVTPVLSATPENFKHNVQSNDIGHRQKFRVQRTTAYQFSESFQIKIPEVQLRLQKKKITLI